MIVMMGPPAAGKGFFLGEPPPKFGWKLPLMLVNEKGDPLMTEADIPERPEQDESDNHLRAIQFEQAKKHFTDLRKAHKKGPKAFKEALADHWYETKDGERMELGDVIKHDEFPDNLDDFFKKSNKKFYVSMRGWHDDAKTKNKETGKPTERFKDEARHRFEDSVGEKIEKVEDLLIVDSAGEDIDAQDYKGQIEQAKANGYEVTCIFLHPEQADTELSNLSRGKVRGKRMVDQQDIDNWYAQNEQALKEIQGAEPDNFVHYRKGPPDGDPKKASDLRAKARSMMEKLSGMDEKEKEKAVKEINKILYAISPYKLNKDTSYGHALEGLPKNPKKKDIAEAVKAMNVEAEKRAGKKAPAEKEKKDEKPEPEANGKPKKKEKDVTRMKFLREVGDQKVPNPNPESRKRFPQVKVRSLPWKHQKKFYHQWRGKAAGHQVTAQQVVARYLEVKMAAEDKGWLANWMSELAEEVGKVKAEGYSLKAKAGKGPIVYATIEDATEDATTARKAKQAIEKIIDASIKKNASGVSGFKSRVKTFNKGADLVLECEVVFP
jgi:hypothetical protein